MSTHYVCGCTSEDCRVNGCLMLRQRNEAKETNLWRCTVCGRVGTVGRCCGEETRERANMGSLQAEIEALKGTIADLEADRQRRGEPVAYGIKAANTGKIVTVLYGRDVDQVGEYLADLVVPLYTTPQPAEPVKVNAIFETENGEAIGTTNAKVKRVEWQDDGSLTVVIDYWPQ